ncbi:uncharacterized protein K02A2.6-like [Nylanderia fulva]|uniref:uncharacterized protein K02A2.6-like n=1 Tax=Nylanderia fulva TaxID=613905 RepID=UPI0010FB8468|nr:uncharacterized protein K02A2.6-like [Nylanderia fulva]
MSDGGTARNDGARDVVQADAMTIVQLRNELRRRKLRTTGNKADLVERFRAAVFLEGQEDGDESSDDGGVRGQVDCESGDESELSDASEDGRRQGPSQEPLRKRERCLLTFKDVEDAIDTFSGDDGKNVKQWIRDFDETASLCQWNDVQKTIYVRRLLRGSAKLFVKYEARGKTWKDIRTALKREFSQKTNSHDVHFQLQRRKKKTDETYHEYCYQMLEIASRAKLEISAVIQYIIDGIADDEVNKIVLYGARSISDLKHKLDIYEIMKIRSRHSKTEDRKRKFIRAENDSKQIDKRCYICGNKNHLIAECPVKGKGVKCFRCGTHGHVAAKCPTVENKQTNKEKNCNATQGETKSCCKTVAINSVELSALIDTGSDISLMRADSYVKIGAPALIKRQMKFRGVGSDENVTLGEVYVSVCVDGCFFGVTFHVVPDALLQHAILIGTDFLNNVELQVKEGVVKISKTAEAFSELPAVNRIDLGDEVNDVNIEHIMDRECKDEIREIISSYKPEKIRDVGIELNIVLKDETPVYQRARRLAVPEQRTLDEQIHRWLDEGIVQQSYSDYASPVVLVKKKNGATRVCVDYRKLNEKIIKTRYPLPIIEDQIDRLRGAKIFSTIDLENGFFHVRVADDSRKYTAFIVPNGHYEFLRMPFGLSTSPAYFQKYVNAVFADLVAKNVVSIYMDDVVYRYATEREA